MTRPYFFLHKEPVIFTPVVLLILSSEQLFYIHYMHELILKEQQITSTFDPCITGVSYFLPRYLH